jgi:tetratricopeptide (TPR) repeat protein
VTIQSLKLPLTNYQLHAWAISAVNPTQEALLTKIFTLGLAVLASPSKWTKVSHVEMTRVVLAHLQSLALQWARLVVLAKQQNKYVIPVTNPHTSNFALLLATAWAAQTALWQLQWLPPDSQRSLLLPRLAESMARRLLLQPENNNKNEIENGENHDDDDDKEPSTSNSAAAEIQILCLKTLENQCKWSEMLELLSLEEQRQSPVAATSLTATESTPDDDGVDRTNMLELTMRPPTMSEFGVALTMYQILTEKARVLKEMEHYEEAKHIYQTLLQESRPDDWLCWMGYWTCCIKSSSSSGGGVDQALQSTHQLIETVLCAGTYGNRRLRGPNLMKVELVALSIRTSRNLSDDQSGEQQQQPAPHESIESLCKAIQVFANHFATKSPCAFSDLNPYLELVLESTRQEGENSGVAMIEALLEWGTTLLCQCSSSSTTNSDAPTSTGDPRSKLRGYIFAARFIHKLLSKFVTLQDRFLPNWTDLVKEWQMSLTLSSAKEGEVASVKCDALSIMLLFWSCGCVFESRTGMSSHLFSTVQPPPPRRPSCCCLLQMFGVCVTSILRLVVSHQCHRQSQQETRPGDDLILLAIQQMMYREPNRNEALVTAAVLLETAIHHSPFNAYLKMSAIEVYYQLNAMSRSWEFFQAIEVKHIQLDSCSYTILPYLLSGGLYNETIEVCNSLLRFQAGTVRDCGDYAGRAMVEGTLSQANEFLVFQRDRMNKSLTVLQAKGMILDSASLLANVISRKKHDENPIFQGGLGVHQGIVGGEADLARATQMVPEAHNPYAALSLVSWADHLVGRSGGDSSGDDDQEWADNRDFSIFSHELLCQSPRESKAEILNDAQRRGHLHGLLIRTTLCLDATKGPKKGKLVKNSEELEKRTASLLTSITATATFLEQKPLHEKNPGSHVACMALVQTMLDLCRFVVVLSSGLSTKEENGSADTLESREQRATELCQSHARKQLQHARQSLTITSVRDVCSLLPNFVVPLFALFRMSSATLALFGWGKRKRHTKKCAGAMAEFAIEFSGLLQTMLSSMER